MITWTLNGDKDSRYNNWLGRTPFGRILITWKGWKEPHSQGVSVDEFPGGFDGVFCSPEDAKLACEEEYARRLRAAIDAAKTPGFLAQIEEAKKSVASWPQWMQDAATTKTAVPRAAIDAAKGR